MTNALISLLASTKAGAAGLIATALDTVGTNDINAEMLAKDPHGIIMSVTSVSVVFLALLILFLCYSLIGKLVNRNWSCPFRRANADTIAQAKKSSDTENAEVAVAISLALKEETSGEVQAAIAMALQEHLNEYPHDLESYIITIKR